MNFLGHSYVTNPRTLGHPKNHPRSRALTILDVRNAARAAVSALAANNLDCCLFGSAACSMYGISRVPNVRDYWLLMILVSDVLVRSEGRRCGRSHQLIWTRNYQGDDRSERRQFLPCEIKTAWSDLQDSLLCAKTLGSLVQSRYPHTRSP